MYIYRFTFIKSDILLNVCNIKGSIFTFTPKEWTEYNKGETQI